MRPEERMAKIFAKHWHTGQYRKYTNNTVPYYLHPGSVAHLLKKHVPDVTPEQIVAAWLHDLYEDTDVTHQEVINTFGIKVHGLVVDLTCPAYPGTNRAQRCQNEILRLSQVCVEAKTIKLADLYDNAVDILEKDPGFARVYLREKRALLDGALKEGNQTLWNMCDVLVRNALPALASSS